MFSSIVCTVEVMATSIIRWGLAAALAQVVVSQNFTCSSDAASTGYNATSQYQGCYNDSSVSILSSAKLSTIITTPQSCTTFCGERGFAYAGIEFGTYVFAWEREASSNTG